MRNTSFFFLLLFFASCNTAPKNAGNINADKTALAPNFNKIDNLLNNQLVAWNTGNIKGFMQGYWNSDSLSFVTKNGERKGWDALYNNYKKKYNSREKMGNLRFEIKNQQFLTKQNNTAQVLGIYHLNKVDYSHDSGYFSLIFKHFDGQGWKIIIDHTF